MLLRNLMVCSLYHCGIKKIVNSCLQEIDMVSSHYIIPLMINFLPFLLNKNQYSKLIILKELNHSSLSEYFTFQNFFSDKTLLKNLYILPAGHYAKFNEKFDLNIFQYWNFNFQEPAKVLNENDYNKELDYLFKSAVQKQLIGDVELGTYLSGGIDSGSITALASKEMNNIKSFTCGFDLSSASGIELTFDEREKAEAMSAKFKTEHYEMVLKAGDMERCMKNLSWHIEEPRVGQVIQFIMLRN